MSKLYGADHARISAAASKLLAVLYLLCWTTFDDVFDAGLHLRLYVFSVVCNEAVFAFCVLFYLQYSTIFARVFGIFLCI